MFRIKPTKLNSFAAIIRESGNLPKCDNSKTQNQIRQQCLNCIVITTHSFAVNAKYNLNSPGFNEADEYLKVHKA